MAKLGSEKAGFLHTPPRLLTSVFSMLSHGLSHPTPFQFLLSHLQPSVLTSLGKPHIFASLHTIVPLLDPFLQTSTFPASARAVGFHVGFRVPSVVSSERRGSVQKVGETWWVSRSQYRFPPGRAVLDCFRLSPKKQATSTK